MLRSNSNPDLLIFDPEIERTPRRARQVRRRIEFENNLHSQTEGLASENNFAYSFDCDFDFKTPNSDIGTSIMGDVQRVTLKAMGDFHGLPDEVPIKHIKDFEVICATTRRSGGDEHGVKVFILPFSLENKAKDWYHTLFDDITSDWVEF
ncbi:hypothetical protein PIB30_097020, partial [Stylosanthes scabra]|nr:hypothetical protein [Stylosanthes scabra]